MSKVATVELAPSERAYDLVDVLDEDNQDWLPLGEPEEIALQAKKDANAQAIPIKLSPDQEAEK